jgi:hypothetical protein
VSDECALRASTQTKRRLFSLPVYVELYVLILTGFVGDFAGIAHITPRAKKAPLKQTRLLYLPSLCSTDSSIPKPHRYNNRISKCPCYQPQIALLVQVLRDGPERSQSQLPLHRLRGKCHNYCVSNTFNANLANRPCCQAHSIFDPSQLAYECFRYVHEGC